MALVALGLLCASCGGNDDSGDQPESAATTPPPSKTTSPSKKSRAPSTGGATAPRGGNSGNGSRGGGSATSRDEPVLPATGDTPDRTVKRRSNKRISRDVYSAGKKTCFIFGIDQIRHEYNLVQRSPEAVARFYANLFEKANPELVAPYYQGCLRGLNQRARRDARAEQQ
jgi:hypothetical protein